MTERKQQTTGVRQRHAKTCRRTGSCRCPWAWSWEGAKDRATGQRAQYAKGGYRTRADALAARNDHAQKHSAGLLAGDRTITVADFLRDWFDRKTIHAETPLRPTTAASYLDHLDRFLVPNLGKIRLHDLRAEDIEKAFSRIRRDHPELSASSRTRIYATLRSALRTAVRRKVLPISPTDAVDLGHAPNPPKVKPWTPEELGTWLDTKELTGHRLMPLFHVMAFSGLRRGEVAGLRWTDLDLDAARITVNQQRTTIGYTVATGAPKTEAGEGRVVPIDAATVTVLRAWRKQQATERLALGEAYADRTGLVFTDALGRAVHPMTIGKVFDRLVKASGVRRCRLHDLRHGFASLLLNSGASMFTVSKILGHADISTTIRIYGHLDPNRAAVDVDQAVALVPRKAASQAV